MIQPSSVDDTLKELYKKNNIKEYIKEVKPIEVNEDLFKF